MAIPARYVHTNLIAKNWRELSNFYIDIFGCIPVPPERDYRGKELDAGTGIKDAHLQGAHLRLPGYADSGPTLEIFNYNILDPKGKTAVNRPGFGHIAFSVDNVESAQKTVIEAGGHALGEIVNLTTKTGATVTWCYVTDPEDNIIELQAWSDH